MLEHANVIIQCTCGIEIRNLAPTCANVPEATCINQVQNKRNPPFYSELTSVPSNLGNAAKTDLFLGGTIMTR